MAVVILSSILSCSYLGRLNISEVFLVGVGEALSSHPQGDSKGIKAHFNMDESGILNLTFVSQCRVTRGSSVDHMTCKAVVT